MRNSIINTITKTISSASILKVSYMLYYSDRAIKVYTINAFKDHRLGIINKEL